MADDVRISVGLSAHPKTKKLKRRLGAGACWSLVVLFLWTGSERWDGTLYGMTDEDIELAADWDGEPGAFVSALIEVGYLDGDSGLRAIHDWQEHNPYAASKGERIARGKAGAAGKWGDRKEAAATRSARLAAARAKGRHTPEQWSSLLSFCGNCCVRCGSLDGIVKDHIIPLYQGGSDGIENLQPLCKSCNSSKGPDDTDHRPANWAECLLDACKTPANACGVVCPPAPAPTLPVEAKAKAKATVEPAVRPCARFDDFWRVYPNKQGKQKAQDRWTRDKLDGMADSIIAHVRLMAGTDDGWIRGYAPMGSTYLNQARWTDVPRAAPQQASSQPSKTMQAVMALEAMNGLDETRGNAGFAKAPVLVTGPDTGYGRLAWDCGGMDGGFDD